MAYRFQSKVAGDVLMLGPAGDSVLSAMGMVPAAKGIIQPESMPAAIKAVEAAIARDESRRPTDRSAADAREPGNDGDAVSLRQRAWPLLEMIKRAHAAGEAIVWGV
jgi:hypothetical protein